MRKSKQPTRCIRNNTTTTKKQISREEDIDRIRQNLKARDKFMKTPNLRTAIKYATARYYMWHRDMTTDGEIGIVIQ